MTARWQCCHCDDPPWIELSGRPEDAEDDARTVVDHLAEAHPQLFDRWSPKPDRPAPQWSPALERALLP